MGKKIKARAVAFVISEYKEGRRHFNVFGGGGDVHTFDELAAFQEALRRNLQLLDRLAELIENSEWNSDFRQVLVDELLIDESGIIHEGEFETEEVNHKTK